MQDWPLEVADRMRLKQFCTFYDDATDAILRFDIMQLILCSYDEYCRMNLGLPDLFFEWIKSRLCRDFALHGNTVAEWAALEREHDDPELSLSDPEFVFAISGMMRQIWENSLIPIEVQIG